MFISNINYYVVRVWQVPQHLSAAELKIFIICEQVTDLTYVGKLELIVIMGFHYQPAPIFNQPFSYNYVYLIITMSNRWVLFALLLPLIFTLPEASLRWGIYRWIDNDKTILEPHSKTKVHLSHPLYPHLSISISSNTEIKQQFNAYNISQYSLSEAGRLTLWSSKTSLAIQMTNVQNLKLAVNCSDDSCQSHSEVISQQVLRTKQFNKYCKEEQNTYSCTVPNTTFIIGIDPTGPCMLTEDTKSQFQSLHEDNLLNLMSFNQIAIEPMKIMIVQQSLSSLINSICLYKAKSEDYFSLGLCQFNARTKRWSYNFKLAAFSIYMLADYHYSLAEQVYRDYFSLLEGKLMYPLEHQSDVLPLPEHIEVFSRFGEVLQLQNEAELLNSLFVIPMLNQLGILHEELNYRQAKKIHPLLLKMLQQRWSASSQKQELRSIYEESFTEDFKYHSYGERLDQSIAKNAWIFKVIDTYTGLLIKHHAFYMPVEQIKEHLQEHFTLLNLIKVYSNDDKQSKVGKYRDIIDVGEDLKLYGKFNGYEAILPFVYGLGKVYPEGTVKQLETNLGLKSSTQESEQHDKKYRYRGDIHTYFNFKILTGCINRIEQDKSLTESQRNEKVAHLTKIATLIGRKVMKDFKEQGQIYTSWTVEGKGRQKNGWGQIISALFLRWA